MVDGNGKIIFERWFEGVITNKERLVTLNGVETSWNYDTPSKVIYYNSSINGDYKGEIHDKHWTVGNWLVQLYDNYGFQPWVVFFTGEIISIIGLVVGKIYECRFLMEYIIHMGMLMEYI